MLDVLGPVEAWGRGCRSWEVIREREGSRLYRLHTEEGPVVAKWSPRAWLERLVYREVLPGLSAPRFLGGEGDWLFVEEVGGEPFEPARHGREAAAWLAALHRVPFVPGLPPVDPFESLPAVRRTLALDRSAEAEVLRRAVDRLEAWRPRIEALGLPPAVVHRDFWGSNVRVLSGRVLPFDWGRAGWGVPLQDLGAVGPGAGLLGVAGRCLHHLEAIPGEAPVLATPRVRRKLAFYAEEVAECLSRWPT